MYSVLDDLVNRIRQRRVVFFLGAGASWEWPANLPTSLELLQELIKPVFLPLTNETGNESTQQILNSIRLEIFMQIMTDELGSKAIEALQILENGQPNQNHLFVAALAEAGHCPLVITTNFDSLIEKALVKTSVSKFEVWYSNGQYRRSLTASSTFKILKLHGSLRDRAGRKVHSSIEISTRDLGRSIPRNKAKTINNILRNYDIVFLGYSGLDDFDLYPLILTTESDRILFWINHQEHQRMTHVRAEDLVFHPTQKVTNHERIVSSRPGSILINGRTQEFVSALCRRLFGFDRFSKEEDRTSYDFGYLKSWGIEVDLDHRRPFLNALFQQHLEEDNSAIFFFEKALSEQPAHEEASLGKSISLRRVGDHSLARENLKRLVNKRGTSRPTRMRALVQLGQLESEQTNLDEAHRYLSSVLRMKPVPPGIRIDVHNILGLNLLFKAESLRMTNAPPKQIETIAKQLFLHLNTARILVGKNGDPRKMANIRGNLGLALSIRGMFKRADKHFLEALRLFRSLQLASEEAACLSNIGYHYKEWSIRKSRISKKESDGLLVVALDFSMQAHALKELVTTPRRIALGMHNIGEIHYMLGNHGLASEWLESALGIFQSKGLDYYAEEIIRLLNEISFDTPN